MKYKNLVMAREFLTDIILLRKVNEADKMNMFLKSAIQKSKRIIVIIMVLLLTSCVFHSDDLGTQTNEELMVTMLSEIKIDFDNDKNWENVAKYSKCLEKPVSESYENYKDWRCVEYYAPWGIEFMNPETDVTYRFFSYDGNGKPADGSPENSKLVLNGTETVVGVIADMSYFFQNFEPMVTFEESVEYLEGELGINKILFNVEETEWGHQYSVKLVANGLYLSIYCDNGRLNKDSRIELNKLSASDCEYWGQEIFERWIDKEAASNVSVK